MESSIPTSSKFKQHTDIRGNDPELFCKAERGQVAPKRILITAQGRQPLVALKSEWLQELMVYLIEEEREQIEDAQRQGQEQDRENRGYSWSCYGE